MPLPTTDWTVEMLDALPEDGNKYEIIDGELFVTPMPRRAHQRVARDLGIVLHTYCVTQSLPVEVFPVPGDIAKGNRTLVQPDVFVIDRTRELDPEKWPPLDALLLAVEILSPGTASRDRGVKRKLYLSTGLEYWIVDIDSRIIERWLPGDSRPEIITDTLRWQPLTATKSLEIDLEKLFGGPRRS